MKLIKLAAAVFTALCLMVTPVFAATETDNADAYKDELKKSSATILKSLMSLGSYQSMTVEGETIVESVTSFLGSTETETSTSKVTGFYQLPDKLYMKTLSDAAQVEVMLNEEGYFMRMGEDGEWVLVMDADELFTGGTDNAEAFENVDISTLMIAQPVDIQSLIKNIEIVNVFEKDGVKYIDINISDFGGMEDKIDEIKSAIAIAAQGQELTDGTPEEEEMVQQVIDAMLDSMEITMSGYYRINANTKTVDGMGYDYVISMEMEIFGFPVVMDSNSNMYLKITGTNEEFVFPSIE